MCQRLKSILCFQYYFYKIINVYRFILQNTYDMLKCLYYGIVFSPINERKKKTKKLVHSWNLCYNFILAVEFMIHWVPISSWEGTLFLRRGKPKKSFFVFFHVIWSIMSDDILHTKSNGKNFQANRTIWWSRIVTFVSKT